MSTVKESAKNRIQLLPKPAFTPHLSSIMVLFFAMVSAMAVANVYFAQPLLDIMAGELNVSPSTIGLVVTLTQAGYALGLIFIVPLGDLWDRRKLIIGQLLLSAAALILASFAPTFSLLLMAMLIIGLMAVVVQVVVAFAATLAPEQQRGKVVGKVTSGIVLGILLARFISGAMADFTGWRSVYFCSAAMMLLMAIVLYFVMPPAAKSAPSSYRQLLLSLCELFINERELRIRATLALLIFMAFSVLWTAMVLPLSSPYYALSHSQVGLFGLAGVAGALAASHAGQRADRGLGAKTTQIALALLLLSWLPIAFLPHSLWWLVLGVVILDFAVQAVHVTNQSIIFALRPDAQSRLVAGYMLFYSIGSAIGAIATTWVFAHAGWSGVCMLGATISAVAILFLHLTYRKDSTCVIN
ncbi:MFS transporter [Yersinia enterocolitica]|uniref:MFS transporter n=1 Tax=Yersinia enterocolitica TaxID=630 RepID=UPI00065A8CEC|nr:MFS transporter [Yersinia enterocolitica]PNM15981.1 MFS transporter [Yersinia enterocolitica]CRY04863.1 putative transporter protein [Yersinia enterocolitica]CRY13999.1 putative transporter protein [Yersinia enterocolitica]HDL8431358.1 MFS transporter [Yersinia enterocolitica]HDL8468936.1 MFS transporter [Yersinia enterocolitica]